MFGLFKKKSPGTSEILHFHSTKTIRQLYFE